MTNVVIYTKDYCGWCKRAKELLADDDMEYTEIDVTPENLTELTKLVAEGKGLIDESELRMTVPQIFINDKYVGGCAELKIWLLSKRVGIPVKCNGTDTPERFIDAATY